MMLEQYNNIHTLLDVLYLQPPHPTVRHQAITALLPACVTSQGQESLTSLVSYVWRCYAGGSAAISHIVGES